MASVEAPLNNDLKPIKKMATTDVKSVGVADGNSLKYSNGYDIEKSLTSQAAVS